MRHFYVTYVFVKRDGKFGYGSIKYWEETEYPSISKIQDAALDETDDITGFTVINVIEFKNEQDYNDFVK